MSNFFNHHQLELCDSFFNILNGSFLFVEMEKIPDQFIKIGYPDLSSRSYVYKFHEKDTKDEFLNFVNTSEIVIFGSVLEDYFTQRMKNNLFTFRYSERWFKKDFRSLFSPRFWWYLLKYHYPYINKNVYMLCASSFTKYDTNLLFLYKNKTFKWGYFPSSSRKIKQVSNNQFEDNFNKDSYVKLIWVGRFIDWKHPELALLVLERLINKGYKVFLEMIGTGNDFIKIQELALKLKIDKYITFKGNLDNDSVNEALYNSDVFLFTSDRNEGWGAVLNEAMFNSCAVVVSDKIGATGFLVKDGKNGIIFKSNDLNSLEQKLEILIKDIELRSILAKNAHITIQEVWNGRVAAENFLKTYESMKMKKQLVIEVGPCSKA